MHEADWLIAMQRFLWLLPVVLTSGCYQTHNNVDAAVDAVAVPIDACRPTGMGDCLDCAPVIRPLTPAEVAGARWAPDDCGDLRRLCNTITLTTCGCVPVSAPLSRVSGVSACRVMTDGTGAAQSLACTAFTCVER